MRNFLVRAALFMGLSFCIILPVELYRMGHIVPSEQIDPEVYYAIDNSMQRHPDCRILLIGDSIGMQLYPCTEVYSDIVSLTCNQAVMLAGHYFMLHNYFEQNSDSLPDEVILIYSPRSFRNKTDKYSFHYFLKPFFTKRYKELYTEALWDAVKSIPFYWLSQFPFVKTSGWSVDYLPGQDESYHMLSPVSSDYLKLIMSLLKDNNVRFRIVAPPLSEINEASFEQYWEGGLNGGEFAGIEQEMIDYHNTFHFWPDSLFKDHIHLLPEYIPQDYLALGHEE